ncbi:MAG: aminoacyl-tRNA deacylase [Gammaproteobacteria bacterium]
MAIANRLRQYMKEQGVEFEVIRHPRSGSSMQSAEVAHIPGDKLAKAVVLEDEQGYLMAVVPATHRIELGALHRELRRELGLATEREIRELFWDCQSGAIPPTGAAYGIETILDDSLADKADVYFEAGDHEELVHVSAEQFRNLMAGIDHARISSRI